MRYAKVRDVKSPTRGTPLSAGIDLYVPNDAWAEDRPNDKEVVVRPGDSILVPSGVKFNVPPGYALIAFNKSGVALKKNLQVGACVVDEDYTGEVQIHLTNIGNKDVAVSRGEKIVQFILVQVDTPSLEECAEERAFEGKCTVRGEGKFGSTGNS